MTWLCLRERWACRSTMPRRCSSSAVDGLQQFELLREAPAIPRRDDPGGSAGTCGPRTYSRRSARAGGSPPRAAPRRRGPQPLAGQGAGGRPGMAARSIRLICAPRLWPRRRHHPLVAHADVSVSSSTRRSDQKFTPGTTALKAWMTVCQSGDMGGDSSKSAPPQRPLPRSRTKAAFGGSYAARCLSYSADRHCKGSFSPQR